MRASLPARLYRRLVPGSLKTRLAPLILRYRRRAEARRAGSVTPDEMWMQQRRVMAAGDAGLRRLAYFPGGIQNPYLRLLYSRVPEAGFDPGPLGPFEALDRASDSSVFHLHWTRIFQVGAGSEREARSQTSAYLARIERFLERGGRMLWSVHETLPHDCEFPEVEIALRGRLVESAAGIHVLHASTVDEVADRYRLDPAKTFVVDHPLYTGVYADYVTRSSARRQLGIDDDEVLLVAFGAIRPYKGFDRLIRLVPRLRRETGLRLRVIVAGPAFKTVDLTSLRELAGATEGVVLSDRPVPDEQVQVLFRAADVAVLPYRQVLNSGVLMLALTFGCPAVAPANPVTVDLVDSGLVHLFDRTDDDDLARAIAAAIARRGDRDAPPSDFTARYNPTVVAGRFADQLQRRIV